MFWVLLKKHLSRWVTSPQPKESLVCFFWLRAFYKFNVTLLALIRNKKFLLDEMTQRNASKFALFYIYENPKFFSIFHFVLLYFFPNECPGHFIKQKLLISDECWLLCSAKGNGFFKDNIKLRTLWRDV